jgi:hypothetical protein
MKTAGNHNVIALTLAGLLIAGGSLATAKPAAKAKHTAAKKAKAAKTAEAKPAKKVVLPVVVKKAPKPGSLEAMLAKARSASKAPAKKNHKKARRAKGNLLGRYTRAAGKLDLGRTSRSTATPGGELMLRMSAAKLDSADVSKVVRANMKKLMFCHDLLAAKGAAPKGDVSLELVVEPLGNVSKVNVKAAGPNHAKMERCMERRIAKWKFPAADAPTTVAYPFVIN